MATTPDYEPDALYIVQLKRAVKYGRMMLRPREEVQLKGKVCTLLADDILTAEKMD
jgi:hypothetical protein